jgi:hypothetical protein
LTALRRIIRGVLAMPGFAASVRKPTEEIRAAVRGVVR